MLLRLGEYHCPKLRFYFKVLSNGFSAFEEMSRPLGVSVFSSQMPLSARRKLISLRLGL